MKSHWLDNPRHIKKLRRLFLVMLALTVIAGFFINLHPHFGIESWFAFNAAYGFITCLLMIVGAREIGALLKRHDRYYAQDDQDE